jgi:subtilisin family serine protease
VIETIFNEKTGSTSLGQLVALSRVAVLEDLRPALDLQIARRANVLNMSLGFPYKGDASEPIAMVKSLISSGVVVVLAAGNEFPQSAEPTWHFPEPAPIQVGSFNVNGDVDNFTGRGPYVQIYAPAGMYMQIVSDDPELMEFGRTSGATPLVTGLIADLKSIRPDLDRSQITKILVNTSFSVAGMNQLNAYRALIAVLKANKDPTNWDDPQTYDFREEAQRTFEIGRSLFENSSTDCKKQLEAVNLVRKAALLGNSASMWQWLSDVYQRSHIAYNAQYYRVLASSAQ